MNQEVQYSNNLPSNIERKELKEEKQDYDEDTFSSRRTQSCESDIQVSSSCSELGANWYPSYRSYNNTCMRFPESIPYRTPRPMYKMPELMSTYRMPESMYRMDEPMSMHRMPRPFLMPCLPGSQGLPYPPRRPGQYPVQFSSKMSNCRCSLPFQ
ncbi:uncharacterized protein LOC114932917 [Nylanderia fulva]|uniref:uncharacterized protein LOC114932917 n=1 Tax=Nylanderia fulva TaxID=613905 RepID=UPI0010FB2EFB|nr:uncharacterized protein LOC114932917 [Nylanderia fulva]XP_029161163.1 uncharacterized protein LOC114932917 [Nylanderia fulva]XP_029161164.1 uncharacterized protein LOC114932917 [Nylanderia fulva]